MKMHKLISVLTSAVMLLGSGGLLPPASAAETVAFSGISGLPFANGEPFKGADISSVIALEQSGVRFYDGSGKEQDIFVTLADAGINCIRVRIWNDPTASQSGVTYGGGANDAKQAVKIAERCAKAGLKLFVDFHYSDFWADPSKQKAPKAWANYSVQQKADAIYNYTKETLGQLDKTGADIAMVQIGNETTAGMCGVLLSDGNWGDAVWNDLAKLWNAGSKAVREYDPNVLVALHFTNPEKASNMQYLAKMVNQTKVDYDVFATSYYPYWHGTLQNLTSVLSGIANTYHKKVLVAETSWAYTFQNYDPGVNTIGSQKDLGNSVSYPVSAAGQTAFLTDLFKAVAAVPDGMGIGVFYWEPAWLPVSSDFNTAKQLWQKYGGGWAYESAQEYDPDAKDYGGSGWENQALFSADGKPLESLYMFRSVTGSGQSNPRQPQQTGENLLKNPGFEADGGWSDHPTGWTLKSTAAGHFDVRAEDVRTGGYALHWYSKTAFRGSTAAASVQVPESGTYRCTMYVQADESSFYTIEADVSGEMREAVTDNGQGWSMWQQKELLVTAQAGDTVTLRLTVEGGDGAYGSADDCCIEKITVPETTEPPVPATTPGPETTIRYDGTTGAPEILTTAAAETTPAAVITTAPTVTLRGDANCDNSADVADAVLIARFCVADAGAVMDEQGLRNADCNRDGGVTADDVSTLLQAIAKIIELS